MVDLDGYQVCDEIGFHWITGGVDLWVCAVWAFVELVGMVGFLNLTYYYYFNIENIKTPQCHKALQGYL